MLSPPSQRTKEIGIRVALGAGLWMVVGMVVKQSVRLVPIGAAVGVVPEMPRTWTPRRPYGATESACGAIENLEAAEVRLT